MTPDPQELPASPSPGVVGSYIHAGGKVGVLVELYCESEFVSRTEAFSELVHDIAMQIAASDPKFIRKEDVTAEAFQREKDIYASQAASTRQAPHVDEKMVEGKMSKFYEEVCLYEQPFFKDQTIKVSELIAAKSDKLGEKIAVRQFARFKVGGSSRTAVANREGPEGGDEAGIAVKKPKRPNLDSGFAAVNPDEEPE